MMPIVEEIRCALFELSDPSYRKFHQKLIPNVDPERVIGVRMPALRKFAKEKAKDPEIDDFIRSLPHEYYEENNVHAEIIALIKDYDLLIEALDAFLPYVDNWATCDSLKPKLFKKRPRGLTDDAKRWMRSEHPYTVRYGIGVLMTYYLDDEFEPSFAKEVAAVRHGDYYVRMMIAWYFATALTKHYDEILPFFKEKVLEPWVHNKAIQKAVESYRVPPEHKEELKKLKIKK